MPASPAPPAKNWRLSITIARSVGIVAITLGFVLGMCGLNHPKSNWLKTDIGLLVTGMVTQR